ncbi:sensor histidine kinase [Streptomyces kaniharaensis]|uniref:Oxygen sensor histidine kinase NreB n=1 Tax=Streptomyces kaniharaensis TaxID=212423 RepID=A0A6N7KR67_9ACTN|nr:sensor histidine kinase [Streptomyces kaniharaensis]MQS12103.1 sensor histidine kinase [Streptomyces kaniharaensis]
MIKEHAADERTLGAWQQRLDRAAGLLGYVALLVATALALLVPVPTARSARVTLPAAAAALLWLLLRSALDRRPGPDGRARYGGAHFLGLLAVTTVLVLDNPIYGFFAFTGYLHASRYLEERARVVGTAAAAVPTTLAQTGGVLPTSGTQAGGFLAVLAFNLVVVGILLALSEVADRLSRRRKEANAELAEANRLLTEMLAENAGLHAQLLVQAREAGAADERRRLAREMHDTVAQGLAGIVTQLQAADQAREQHAPAKQWQRHLDSAAALARESLTQARRAVHALRPLELERAALPEALAELVEQWRERNSAAAGLTVTGEARPLHPEVEVTLLRIAQESLANAAKYARASRIGLTLSYMPDLVTLDVRDDGVGFDPAAEPASRATGGGYGLTVMRRRAERLAGRLDLETEPGAGTTVSATLPAISTEE